MNDFKYAIRQLAKQPGFTLVVVLTLALAIGGTTSIFSVVEGVLLRSLPYESPDRLVMLWETDAASGARQSASYPNFADWRDQARQLDAVAGFEGWEVTLTGTVAPAEALLGGRVTSHFFSVLGIAPRVGRTFRPDDETAGNEHVVVLSHEMWQQRFGGRADAVGRTLTLNGEPYEIVGVLPAGFRFPPLPEARIWLPLALNDAPREQRGNHFLRVVARLSPGATVATAQEELDVIAARLASAYPESNTGQGVRVVSLHEEVVGDVKVALLVLLGAVGVVLLIACANIASLFLTRAIARRREVAVRAALGASRGRLVRQVLVESVVMALAAGSIGAGLSFWAVDVLVRLSPGDLPRAEGIGINTAVLAFTLIVSIGSGVLFGLLPALQTAAAGTAPASLGAEARHSGDRRTGRVRATLVLGQIALTLVLTVGAGLLLKSFMRLSAVDPGIRPDRVLTFDLSLPSSRYGDQADVRRFSNDVLARMRALPGVVSASTLLGLPFRQQHVLYSSFTVEGRSAPPHGEEPAAKLAVVMPDAFRTLGLPLLRGRPVLPSDDETAAPVVVINQTMADRYWPGEDPLGRRIELGLHTAGETPGPREIVGIVGDVRQHGLTVAAQPEMYVPQLQFPIGLLTVVVRTTGPVEALAPAMRAAIGNLDPDIPLRTLKPMEELVRETMAHPRFYLTVVGLFAGLALGLAALGIYGVLAYGVSQRTREIGIRVAVGARRPQVLGLVLRQALTLATVGIATGVLASLATTRALSGLLFDVPPTDVWTFVIVSSVVLAVALLAAYVPARRAARIDPMEALRYE